MADQLTQLLKGIENIIPQDEFIQALRQGKHFNIKFGADPSAPDLHLGHLVVLRKLRQFQDAGHSVTFIIGDFTARIGDPTGKNETRPAIDPQAVKRYAETYQKQVFRVLDPQKTTVVYNAVWLDALKPVDILQLMAKSTVAQLLERDDFQKRFLAQHPIGLHEFLYPILQGYDSVHLKSQVEMGGSDQTFNMLMGRQLQKALGQTQQFVLTLPLLEGLDGTQKMSKSLGNHVAFNDSAVDQYGKIMSLPDALMERYFLLLTDAAEADVKRWIKEEHPKNLKQRLARTLTGMFYAPAEAEAAETHFETVFSQRETPTDMPAIVLRQVTPLLDLLTLHGEVPSRSEAKRLVQSGAVSLDGEKMTDIQCNITPQTQPQVLKIGKRKFFKLTFD